MSEFSTPYVRNTRMGYCLTTLEIALNHILGINKEELFAGDELEDVRSARSSNNWVESRRSITQSFK